MDRTQTVQEQIQSHNQALEQNQKWITIKEKEVKIAQSVIKKYKAQIKTITLEKELALRINNLCFLCHKKLSSDEVKFCIDKNLEPLCQTCQRKSRSSISSEQPQEPSPTVKA